MSDASFVEDALATHNAHRARHGAPPLNLSPRLCKSAQEWAEKLLTLSMLQNSPLANQGDVGENISMRRGSDIVDISGKEVSDQWYNDIAKYDFESGTGEAGNFTQLVWQSTNEAGYGKARSADGLRCIVVAHYSPPGNVIGLYVTNVRPATEKPVAAPLVAPTVAAAGPRTTGTPLESGRLPSGRRNAQPSVSVERVLGADGRPAFVRRAVIEYKDSKGHPVRRVHEVQFASEPEAAAYSKVHRDESPTSSETSSDEEGVISVDLRRRKRDLAKFRAEIVRLHNRYRKTHGIDRLHRNRELDASAAKWAEALLTQQTLSNSNHLHKSLRVGENIASRRSNAPCDYTADEVVEHWYLEQNKFQYGVEPSDVQGIGNFTQMLWRGSREIGVGKAVKQDPATGATRVVVVCHYFPAGNVLTQFVENVPARK